MIQLLFTSNLINHVLILKAHGQLIICAHFNLMCKKSPTLIKLGESIRELSKAKGLSQESFADEVGLDRHICAVLYVVNETLLP